MGRTIRNKTNLPTRFLARLVRWTIAELEGEPKSAFQTVVTQRTPHTFELKREFRAPKVQQVSFVNTNQETYANYLDKSALRKRGDFPMQLTIHVGPVEGTDGATDDLYAVGRLYKIIICIAATLHPNKVPPGELGIYRLPIGAKFTQHSEQIIASWKDGLPPPDPHARKRKRLKVATEKVDEWQRNLKLAQTKLKIWTRRKRKANESLETAITAEGKAG